MKKSKVLFYYLLCGVMFVFSCSSTQEKIYVQDGEIGDVEIEGLKKNPKGYLYSDGDFYLRAKDAVFGDDILIKIKLLLDGSEEYIDITALDNSLQLYRDKNIETENGVNQMRLIGPSIPKTVYLGSIGDYIKPDTPFEIVISYRNRHLEYEINGKKIYSERAQIVPSGMVMLFGSGDIEIYDIVCKGKIKPIEKFYNKKFLLERAQRSVEITAELVKDDPNRPAFHFLPPARWNNDPNGLLYYKGYYHLFYQLGPYADFWSWVNWIYWGHARSKDLVYWEHLPIALWPSFEKGENTCFSGGGFIKDDGEPILFYTSIGHRNPEIWAALPLDDELKNWKKHPSNPILTMDIHGGLYIEDWRDPFLFEEGGNVYMVVGGHPKGGEGSVYMYEALNPELTKWKFVGIPFTGEGYTWEVPNFFKLEDKYVLIYSPISKVRYYVGNMDFEEVKFIPEYHGVVDNGPDWSFYAPHTLQKEDGKRILLGWISGFKEGQGWAGAISLPRELSIDGKGRLIQRPIKELTKLRENHNSLTNITLKGSSGKRVKIDFPQFEMILKVANQGTKGIGFRFNDENQNPFKIIIQPDMLQFGEEKIKVDPPLSSDIQTVHLFFDHTVIEMFINGGLLCATKVVYPSMDDFDFEIFSPQGEVTITAIDVWQMKSIW